MRVDVGKQDLESAWNRHRSAAREVTENDSLLLLLVYAVECGLNLVLLVQRGLHHTSQIADDDRFGHAIDRLAKRLGAPGVAGFTAERPAQYVAPEDLHSLFRYGGRLSRTDRQRLVARLNEIMAWIEENRRG